MSRWLSPSRYSSAALFVILGIFAVVFAWNTFDLARLAMANARFLGEYGLLAIRDGGLWQLAEIAVRGVVSLAAYLGIKVCESELVHRWLGK